MKWNLSSLYHSINDSKIHSDITNMTMMIEEFVSNYENRIKGISASEFLCSIQKVEEICDIARKIISYCLLIKSTNLHDEQVINSANDIINLINDCNKKIIFFELEIREIDEAQLGNHFNNSSKLNKYQNWLTFVRNFKDFTLAKDLEKLSFDYESKIKMGWDNLFDFLVSEMRFEVNNKSMLLGEAINLFSDNDSEVRKSAASVISAKFKENIKLFTHIFNNIISIKNVSDQWRGYESVLSYRNRCNMVDDEQVLQLLDTISSNYNKTSHRYFKLKSKILGVEKLNYWDRSAPLSSFGKKFSWEEAKKIVLDTYYSFHKRFGEIAEMFFDNNWIDSDITVGKASGAFSCSTYSKGNPFILLNFQGNIRDVMTLAHELGHGIHQYLSSHNGSLMSDTPLTIAETASIFGEQLVFDNIIETVEDKKEKIFLLANKIEDTISTIIRQIAFCKFEIDIHQARKTSELSSDFICEKWMARQYESFGDAVIVNEDYRYFWCYVLHFIHYPFYVYSYSFGNCVVNALYTKYKENNTHFREEYLKILTMGNALHYKELLKICGLDIEKNDFWILGIQYIEEKITQLEELINS